MTKSRAFSNLLGSAILFGMYIAVLFALWQLWPMPFDHAAAILLLAILAEVRWHQQDRGAVAQHPTAASDEVCDCNTDQAYVCRRATPPNSRLPLCRFRR